MNSLTLVAVILIGVAGCGRPKTTGKSGDSEPSDPARTSEFVIERQSSITTALPMTRALDRPSDDGWNSEAFAQLASRALGRIASAIRERNINTSELLADDNGFGELRPSSGKHLECLFSSDACVVYAATPEWENTRTNTGSFSSQLQMLRRPFGDAVVEVHFKVISVGALPDDQVSTRVLFDAKTVGADAEKYIQQNATWDCIWKRPENETELPTLQSVKVSSYHENHSQVSSGKWYSEQTLGVAGNTAAYREQLQYGLNHWLKRIERSQMMDDSVRTGLAIGDVNGDGREDLYRCQGPGLPNVLFLQQPDGTLHDARETSGTDWLDGSSAALILDFDNDGVQDLAVATRAGVLVMQNDGSGSFELRAQLGPDGIDCQSLTASDYDQDGDLDLFVCAYRPAAGRRSGDFVFHDAVTGGRNYLFRNNCESKPWSWQDATVESGLNVGATRYSLAAAWEDFDNDGDQDLYVANDYGRNYLYRNDNGHFVDATTECGLQDTGFGMSVSWADYDRDGQLDLYVGNMFSSAGHRITSDPKFQPNSSAEQRAIYRRMAKGNSLFRNINGKFTEVTDQAGVSMGRWAWSSVFADINHDGFDDIVIANGYITTDDTGDL